MLREGSLARMGSSSPATLRSTTLASLTGRLGYSWERTLFYVKGGLAFGDVTAQMTFNTPAVLVFPTTSTSKTLTGWIVGAGAEFALSEHWSAKGEWMYFDLGSETYVVNMLRATGVIDADTTAELVRVGVNYHFGH